jgi:hypothetical protein
MNPLVELNLALILFLPWFTILAVLFWKFPRHPRGPMRLLFDATSLLLAVVAAAIGMYWSMATADRAFGHMWQQVLATSVSYGMFLLVVGAALLVRWRWLPRATPSPDALASSVSEVPQP